VREDGTPVTVEAIFGCMACEQCERGAFNLCPTHTQRALGVSADGGMVEIDWDRIFLKSASSRRSATASTTAGAT